MRIGVLLEAFLDRPLPDVLDLLAESCPQVTDLEIGVGGFAPAPHCDVPLLLRDASARRRWLARDRGAGLSRLGPQRLRQPARSRPGRRWAARPRTCATPCGSRRCSAIDRVIAMAGCPAGGAGRRDRALRRRRAGCRTSPASTSGSGNRRSAPTGRRSARSPRPSIPRSLICLELHPGSAAYNVETFERVAGLIGPNIAANLDPSHLFWQQMDPLADRRAARPADRPRAREGRRLQRRSRSALYGLLDHRWAPTDADAPWTFAAAGRGHDEAWWRSFLEALARCGVETISIEHEDPLLTVEQSVANAASVLAEAGTSH